MNQHAQKSDCPPFIKKEKRKKKELVNGVFENIGPFPLNENFLACLRCYKAFLIIQVINVKQ
jgi:hypothetical protein